jgi:hypothetical protein
MTKMWESYTWAFIRVFGLDLFTLNLLQLINYSLSFLTPHWFLQHFHF